MTSIYLSSTYEDLKDYRTAVVQALRQAGYEVRAMEDYVAADKRPVDKCLSDVAEADIYVGVFAFRYGYVPPPEHGNPDALSITELEFRHAEKLKKPCLTFAVSEDAAWPREFDDRRIDQEHKGARINRLREYLLTEKTASFFSLPHELASLVQAAVTKQLKGPRDDLRNRRNLLAELKKEVIGRLTQSLHGELIKLRKETKPQVVQRPWDDEVKVAAHRSVLLDPETEIIKVFDEEPIDGKLLILGAPGAGKTTTLLQLAGKLLERAENDTGEPMPVLLNLSSWKNDTQTIANWMVAELHIKYGVRKDISQRWLDHRFLLPLLDGLDEVEPARQQRCVVAINQFQSAFRPEHLVLCCRLDEYQSCETKLQLHGAIHLQPLTENQIYHYLHGTKRLELWNDIQTAPELLELVSSPLLLAMTTLGYEEGAIQAQQRLGATQEGRKYLFDMYIKRMLSRANKDQQYAQDKTLDWLGWLARGLHSNGQTEFLLETLQPSWLGSPAQRLTYRSWVFLFVVIFILVNFWLRDWIMDLLPEGPLLIKVKEWLANRSEPAVGSWLKNSGGWSKTILSLNSIVAVIVGLAIALRPTIKPIETLRWSGAKAWTGMVLGFRRGAIGGLKYGAYIGLVAGLVFWAIWTLGNAQLNTGGLSAIELAKWDTSGRIAGVTVSLITWLTILGIARSSFRRIDDLWDWHVITSGEVLLSGFVFGLASSISFGWSSGPYMGLLLGALCGLAIGIITRISRNQSDRLFTVADGMIVGLIGWLLYGVITWLLGWQFLEGFTIGLFHWMDLWLLAWLGIGSAAGVSTALIAKLRARARAVRTLEGEITHVWQWIALRWQRWLLAGAVAALVASLIMGLLIALGGRFIKTLAIFFSSLGVALSTMLGGPIAIALIAAVAFVFCLALPVGLIGAITDGLTGPDIQRRTMPNQGIRQSAVNSGRFALMGGLLLGSIWGLWNLVFAVFATGILPETWDCFSIWLPSVLLWALLAALVPGAACVQHFTLRLVLWWRGVIPWQYARFLDHATERMFLQRIGGRYRFIHELLRDHLAAAQLKH